MEKTTIWGMVAAAGVAVLDYLKTGGDFTSPEFWLGLLIAAALGMKGYYARSHA